MQVLYFGIFTWSLPLINIYFISEMEQLLLINIISRVGFGIEKLNTFDLWIQDGLEGYSAG